MKKLFVLLFIITYSSSVFACTAVFMNRGDGRLIGRTMDWKTGDYEVLTNNAGIKKVAADLQDGSKPAEWTSKYKSVTFNMKIKFNLLARLVIAFKRIKTSAPSCGMNEKGLWGGSLWIHPPPAVIYESKDDRGSINDWQALEYILDTSANVSEAVRNIKKMRVSGFKEEGFETDLHWFIADVGGDSAMIEFPDGKLRIHRNPKPPVMTNSFYEHSMEYLRGYKGFGGKKDIPLESGEMTSENRFLFAAYSLADAEKNGKTIESDVFNIMKTVTQTDVRHMETSQAITQWTAVYDLNNRRVYWTSRNDDRIRTASLDK